MRCRYLVGVMTLVLVPVAMIGGFFWGLAWGWAIFSNEDEDLSTSTTETPVT